MTSDETHDGKKNQTNTSDVLHTIRYRVKTMFSFPFVQGKVEMTLELLTENEVAEKPAGKGREEPNAHPRLDEPKYVIIFYYQSITP